MDHLNIFLIVAIIAFFVTLITHLKNSINRKFEEQNTKMLKLEKEINEMQKNKK